MKKEEAAWHSPEQRKSDYSGERQNRVSPYVQNGARKNKNIDIEQMIKRNFLD